jgi:hypothetical protein
VEQVMAIRTIVSRGGHGDFIWLTWTPTKKSRRVDGVSQPNTGCACVAVSKAGAANLYTVM